MPNGSTTHTENPLIPETPKRLNRSCSECTRRKVKCDGGQPCGACTYHKAPHLCGYRQRTRRSGVRRSTHEELAERLQLRTRLLEKLFDGRDFDELAERSRYELLSILQVSHASSPGLLQHGQGSEEPRSPDDSGAVSVIGEDVTQRQWDESQHQLQAQKTGDDINAINLATDHHRRSYLGVSSVSAILKSIFQLCPAAKRHVAECAKTWSYNEAIQPSPFMPVFGVDAASNSLREQRCIDFYFEHIHAIVPMLDEEDFRATFASGHRRDPGWLGLLQMVIILGSIASGSDTLHDRYYAQARSFLDLDSLGAGNLESLQALTLLGGMYLHYRNAPNMGCAILGAAQRIAIGLGLHREPGRRNTADTETTHGRLSRVEVGRRTWWCLFCLDTWASMTLGRPTSGRWEADTMDTKLPTPASEDDYAVLSINASSHFCLLATRIQHRFAHFSRLSLSEALLFDQELQAWYSALPTVILSTVNSPSRMTVAREFMRNRYYNVRLILLRSLIIYMARDRIEAQSDPDAVGLITTCRQVASEAIESIVLHWTPNRIHAWNAAWYLFQSCMVSILLILVERSHPEPSIEPSARATVMKAIETFSEMRLWMRSSDRGPDIISALFEATSTESEQTEQTPSQGDSNFLGWCDEQLMFPDLNWSLLLGNGEFQEDMLQTYRPAE